MCETWAKARRASDGTESWREGDVAPTLSPFDNTGPVRATVLTSSTAASPVRTYPWRERARDWLESEAACGLSSGSSCPNCGPRGFASRMSLDFYPPVVAPSAAPVPDFFGFTGDFANGLPLAQEVRSLSRALAVSDGLRYERLTRAVISSTSSPGWMSSGMAWRGRYWTRSTSGSPSAGVAVFVVGNLGDATRAASVLAVCEGCGGDSPQGRAAGEGTTGAVAVRTANTGANGHGIAEDVAHTLDGAQGQAVLANPLAAHHSRHDLDMDTYVTGAVTAKWSKGSGGPAVDQHYNLTWVPEVSSTLAAGAHPGGLNGQEAETQTPAIGSGVRRLTPLECERLMGWPDEWTRWACRDGRVVEVPDSHRYRMCGNGVVAPVAEYIGRRMVAVHDEGATR